jgi:zinc transport system substrate-binding protein
VTLIRNSGRLVTIGLFIFLYSGCPSDRAPTPVDERPLVVISVAPLASLAAAVAGDDFRIETLLPPAANPTTFEPSMRQMANLERATMVVRVGHPHFPLEETWLTPEAAMGMDRIVLNAVESDSGEDPHVWWDPTITADFVMRLGVELAEHFREDDLQTAERILANTERVLARIRELDESAKRRLEPWQGRTFLVFHPAWGHFAEHFKLRQLAVEGHGQEPGAADLARTIEEARRLGIHTLFIQPQFSPRAAKPVAETIHADMVVLDPLSAEWFGGFEATVDALVHTFEQEDLEARSE